MFDEARSISTMLKARGMTQEAIAKMLGVSQPYIANKLRLLSYSEGCEELITKYGLSERHARSILRLGSEEERLYAIERVHERGYTVYECEGMVDMLRDERLPERLEAEVGPKRLSVFMDAVDGGIRTLRGLGYRIKKTTNYSEGRTLITITLDEKLEYANI